MRCAYACVQEPISVDDIIAQMKQNRASNKRKRIPDKEDEDDRPLDSETGPIGGEGCNGSDESEFTGFEAGDADDPLVSSG